MKRFLLVATALLALGAVTTNVTVSQAHEAPLKLNYRAMNKLGWKLTCQAWTFREMSAFEALDTMHSLGIRYVQFYPGQKFSKEKPDAKLDHNMSPELVAELKEKLKAVKITPVCYGVVGFGKDEAGARKVFDWAKTMGIINVVSEPAEDTVPMLDTLAQEYKINVAIHDHPKPSHYWDPDTVLKVAQGRSKRIGFCADTGHWYRSGLVPVECLKKAEGRMFDMHFKDLSPDKHDVPWGTGQCNARAMLEEVKRQGAKPTISIEYEYGSGPELVANVKKCVLWFDQQATELAK
ncbi:MAG: Xylose isomerase-like barrel [Armatimonadetes bacterium]|nr:Xylose isomerase-like barrel [Armatimonadota bacterium]